MAAPSRRRFLKTTALALAGASLPLSFLMRENKKNKHIGLQLWSIRDEMNKNPSATLAEVARMGYKEVEPFGFDSGKLFQVSYADFGKMLSDNGLSMPSTHCAITGAQYDAKSRDINDEAKRIIDNAARAGLKYLVIPWMGEENRKNIGQMTQTLQAAGAYCKKAGIRLGYHNHDFEFTTKGPDGRLIMEWMLQDVPADLITFEMDIYWVTYAGQDPAAWLQRFPNRWELCHVKDMANTADRETIEVGDGTINFKNLFKNRKKAGLEYFIVELENYRTTPLLGVERAYKNLKSII